jgi:hypothetical protein
MKRTFLILTVMLLLNGCQAGKATYHIDKEFGMATRAALEQQIANPAMAISDIPEGVAGINAERMMIIHNDGFGKIQTQRDIFTIQLAK